jgi:hypothetical protein
MAKQKKRPAARKGKSAARRKPTRGRATKRAVAQATARKRLTKAKPKRAGAKKDERKKVRATKPQITPAVETVAVNVIEEPTPAALGSRTSVTSTAVTTATPQPEEGPDSALPESEVGYPVRP